VKLFMAGLVFGALLGGAAATMVGGAVRGLRPNPARGPVGQNLQCAHGICVGRSIRDVRSLEGSFGGLQWVRFDLDPDDPSDLSSVVSPTVLASQRSDTFVASYSSYDRLTGLWVKDGVIARIDQSPLHTIDP